MLVVGAVIVGCVIAVIVILMRTQNRPSLEVSLGSPDQPPIEKIEKEAASAKRA